MTEQDEQKPQKGRPFLAPEVKQTEVIRARVTKSQLEEYEARGGKAWLVRELGRKPRK